MPESKNLLSPPYASFKQFTNLFSKLNEFGAPSRIDKSVFNNASGSIIYSVLNSLKFLKLIDENGSPSVEFIKLVELQEDQRPAVLKGVIVAGYPTLFSSDFPLTKASSGQFDQHLREVLGAQGSTVDKVAAFFISAVKYSSIEISPQILARKPQYASPSSKKSSTQRKKTKTTVDCKDGNLPTAGNLPITELALEYRLVDLISEAAHDPEVMTAIIKVITFLKTKGQSDED